MNTGQKQKNINNMYQINYSPYIKKQIQQFSTSPQTYNDYRISDKNVFSYKIKLD